MAVDLSKPLIDSEGRRIEKVQDLWTFFTKDGNPSTSEAMAPKRSLVEMVKACRYQMGFYHFAGELRRWKLTIQDCYRENSRATTQALNDSFGHMMCAFADLGRKYHQYRQSIASIGNCDDLDPEVRKMIDNFLYIWDHLDIEAK